MLERCTAAACTSGSSSVGCNGAAGGGGSDWKSGRVNVDLVEVGWRAEVVEPRRADRGGGDVRSGGDAEAADAANPLRGAVR